jgi:hypothetical protein
LTQFSEAHSAGVEQLPPSGTHVLGVIVSVAVGVLVAVGSMHVLSPTQT